MTVNTFLFTRVLVLGFTDKASKYVERTDALLTKSGGNQ